MKLVTIAGPPSSGKTAVTIKAIAALQQEGVKVGVVKFDSLSTQDQSLYEKQGVAVTSGLSGNLCPDHFFVSNVSDCLTWGAQKGFNLLVIESAGLCNRCAPHIQGVLAVCVIDNLSGVDMTVKLGKVSLFGDDYYSLNAGFGSVSGLRVDSPVEINGLVVGRVKRLAMNQEKQVAMVELNIQKGIMIYDDASAAIKTSGLIGDKFVKIDPGGGDILKPGGTISETSSPLDIEDLIGKY